MWIMQEVDNVLRILEETKQAIQENDPYKIKRLSGQTIHTATTSQDADNIIVAVLVYAIAKMIERENYKKMTGWNEFYKNLLINLDYVIKSLQQNKIQGFRIGFGKIRNSINKISGDLRNYMQDVFRKAEINKAFRLYEQGLSAEQTAELLGISLWDLATYIGQSSISEAKETRGLSVKQRIKITEDFFK